MPRQDALLKCSESRRTTRREAGTNVSIDDLPRDGTHIKGHQMGPGQGGERLMMKIILFKN